MIRPFPWREVIITRRNFLLNLWRISSYFFQFKIFYICWTCAVLELKVKSLRFWGTLVANSITKIYHRDNLIKILGQCNIFSQGISIFNYKKNLFETKGLLSGVYIFFSLTWNRNCLKLFLLCAHPFFPLQKNNTHTSLLALLLNWVQ